MRQTSLLLLTLITALFTASCKKSSIKPLSQEAESAITPIASLSTPTYSGGHSALNNAGTATLNLTFTDAHAAHLTAASGSTSAAPAGLTVSTAGGVSCSNLSVTSVSTAGATISVASCTGTGTVLLTVDAGAVVSETETASDASAQRTVVVDNTPPTATVALTNTVVGTTNGANTFTATFSGLVTALSATNANGEITFTGCAVAPSVSIAMSTVSGNSVATATFSGGTCVNGSTVSVQLHTNQVTDGAGNAGVANPAAATYTIDTTLPVATLAAATYSGGHTAINSASSADLSLAFSNTASTSLTASTGTTSAAPTGLVVSTSGTASCTHVEIQNPTASGATLNIGGCTGDGDVSVQVAANVATSSGGTQNTASVARVVTVQNTAPTASLAATTAIVGSTNGANTVTATFTAMVANLSTTNANAEFVISGCTSAPSVSIAMSTSSGHSVATATLSGGTCADGSTVTVTLQRDKVSDLAGNAGVAAGSPSASYSIDTTAPTATLASATYPGSQAAMKNADTTTLALTYAAAVSQTLTASSGTTASAPTGLTVSTTGSASCAVAIGSPSTSGATISISSCTGDGSVLVRVAAGVATSAGGLTNAASAQQKVWVQNTPPTVNLSGSLGMGNTATATFSSLVAALSPTNANGEVDITGCTGTPPYVAIAMSDDGSGHSIATLTLNCTSGDSVNVQMHLENLTDAAGNIGQVSDNPAPETYSIP